MRVALLNDDWLPTGGVATYVRLLAHALAAQGHDVLVVHAGRDDCQRQHPRLEVSGIVGALRDYGHVANEGASAAVADRLAAFSPDVVHLHANTNFTLEEAVWNRWPSVRTVHTLEFCPSGTKHHFAIGKSCHHVTGPMCLPRQAYLRCTLSKRPQVWWDQYRRAERFNDMARAYRQMVVASRYAADVAVANGVDADRVTVNPYPVEPPDQVDSPRGRGILYVGRVTPEKGVDQLLDAAAQLRGDWTVTVVGDGMALPELRRRAERSAYHSRVFFRGWLQGAALAQAYRDAAVVAVPSRWSEPFGIVGLEALGHARPVVAFDTGGISEWLRTDVDGVLVPPEDASAMAHALQTLLDSPERAAHLGANGRARVLADFSMARHLSALMPVYDRTIASH